MKCIVGLGNPGKKYELTRHNLGRLLIRMVAEKNGVSLSKKEKWKSLACEFDCHGEQVLLLAPETYMNLSGVSVREATRFFNINVERDLLVVSDDLDLPFGKMRLRAEGGTGGHNGLLSICEAVGSDRFARLRLGIGRPEEGSSKELISDFVLGSFFEEEKSELKAFLERAYSGCLQWLNLPIHEAINHVNA